VGPAPGLRDEAPARPSLRSTSWAVVRLVRAENCLLAGLATLVGAGTASAPMGGPAPGRLALVGAAVIVMLVLAFGNVLNDVGDQEGDRAGKGRRPLPSGQVSAPQAVGLAAALLTGAVGVTLATSPRLLPLVLAMGLVAALYTPFLKRVPLLGNAVVAAQTGATLVFGALVAGGVQGTTVGGAVLVAVGILSVEVAKTVEDHPADHRVGTRTIAHLVAPGHHRHLVGGIAAAYVVVWVGLWTTARHPALFALAGAPILPLLAFAVRPAGPATAAASVVVPRFIAASKWLWPLVLVGLTGL